MYLLFSLALFPYRGPFEHLPPPTTPRGGRAPQGSQSPSKHGYQRCASYAGGHTSNLFHPTHGLLLPSSWPHPIWPRGGNFTNTTHPLGTNTYSSCRRHAPGEHPFQYSCWGSIQFISRRHAIWFSPWRKSYKYPPTCFKCPPATQGRSFWCPSCSEYSTCPPPLSEYSSWPPTFSEPSTCRSPAGEYSIWCSQTWSHQCSRLSNGGHTLTSCWSAPHGGRGTIHNP